MREFKWENVEECLEVLANYEEKKETPARGGIPCTTF